MNRNQWEIFDEGGSVGAYHYYHDVIHKKLKKGDIMIGDWILETARFFIRNKGISFLEVALIVLIAIELYQWHQRRKDL